MADANRDLLFGLIALQNGMIDQSQLVAAFQAWTLDKDRPLAEHLVGRGDLEADQRAIIEAMVGLHLKKHAGSTEKSLAAIPSAASTRQTLERIADRDLGRQPGPARARYRWRRREAPSSADRTGSFAGVTLTETDPGSEPADRRRVEGRRSMDRPGDISSSARSPGAGWGPCSGVATRTSTATWR